MSKINEGDEEILALVVQAEIFFPTSDNLGREECEKIAEDIKKFFEASGFEDYDLHVNLYKASLVESEPQDMIISPTTIIN